MLKLTKKKLFDLANEGKTLWDLYEILQVYNEREYNEYLREVFGDNYEEYNIFNDQVNLNHFKYRVLNNHSTDNITINDLLKMLNEGKSKIDFMRLFGVITTNKLYKEIKKIFEYSDDTEGFEAFKKRLIKNTKRIMSRNDNTKPEEKNIVYLYALDYLIANQDSENLNIPSNKEAYLFDISYYLNKFGDSSFIRNIIKVFNTNPNVHRLERSEIIKDTGVGTSDIYFLINAAINLKRIGKIPIIITKNEYNYMKCLYYNIYFYPNVASNELIESIDKTPKESNVSLPYICYDSSYILKLMEDQNDMENFINDTKSNKIIFSHVLAKVFHIVEISHMESYYKYFTDIAFSILFNPTMHFVQSISYENAYDFDNENFINNVLNLSITHQNISIATDDIDIITYALRNNINLYNNEQK